MHYWGVFLGFISGTGLIVALSKWFLPAWWTAICIGIGGALFVSGIPVGAVLGDDAMAGLLSGTGAMVLGETILGDPMRWIRFNQRTSGRVVRWHAVESHSRFVTVVTAIGAVVWGASLATAVVLHPSYFW
jgi:hypothetical protein